MTYFVFKIKNKIFNIFNNDDTVICFIGVDGSGKSSVIEEISTICSKGGIFPVIKYFGISKSIIKSLKSNNYKNIQGTRNNKKNISTNKNLKLFDQFKIISYWLEYNLRFFYLIKLKKNSAKSLYILDRHYVDILFFNHTYNSKLFLKYSFKPDYLIYLTGDMKIILKRKNEFNLTYLKELDKFYSNIYSLFKLEHDKKILINTTITEIQDASYKILNNIN